MHQFHMIWYTFISFNFLRKILIELGEGNHGNVLKMFLQNFTTDINSKKNVPIIKNTPTWLNHLWMIQCQCSAMLNPVDSLHCWQYECEGHKVGHFLLFLSRVHGKWLSSHILCVHISSLLLCNSGPCIGLVFPIFL